MNIANLQSEIDEVQHSIDNPHFSPKSQSYHFLKQKMQHIRTNFYMFREGFQKHNPNRYNKLLNSFDTLSNSWNLMESRFSSFQPDYFISKDQAKYRGLGNTPLFYQDVDNDIDFEDVPFSESTFDNSKNQKCSILSFLSIILILLFLIFVLKSASTRSKNGFPLVVPNPLFNKSHVNSSQIRKLPIS